MNYEVRFESKAEQDILNAARFYEQQRAELAHDFLDRIKETIEIVQNQPRLFAESYRKYRRALLRQFPYALYYRIDQAIILVSAVLHQRQDHSNLE